MARETVIRHATPGDLPVLGRLGAHLLRTHYAFDQQRFMAPGSNPEEAYAQFLGRELQSDTVTVLVAERDGAVLGYVYAGLEPQSWKELRERAGFIHDVVVAEAGRRMGIAAALIETALEWMRGRGVTQALLWTATQNEPAQLLFRRIGFRPTMIEMTKQL
jgi:ribosomal protein S18 acetylase RimI-like enzyme